MTTPDADGLLAEQLLRLTRRLHRIQKRHLERRELGITPAQSRLLRTLAHYAPPPRMADLARAPGGGAPRRDHAGRRPGGERQGAPGARSGQPPGDPDRAHRRRAARRCGELRGARRAAAEEILAPLTDEQREVLGGLLDTLVDGKTAPPCRAASASGRSWAMTLPAWPEARFWAVTVENQFASSSVTASTCHGLLPPSTDGAQACP